MRLGLAILGASHVASKYVNICRALPEISVIGIYSESAKRAADFATQHRLSIGTSNLSELLDHPEVDCVLVATEPERHLKLALYALQRGKHTLIEKPLSSDLDGAVHFLTEIRNHKFVCSVVSQKRFDPNLLLMKQEIEKWENEPNFITLEDFRFRDQNYYEAGSGWRKHGSHYFLNQGIHWLDVILWFFGKPVSVDALPVPNRRSLDCSDRSIAILRWDNGSVASIMGGSFSRSNTVEKFTVHSRIGRVTNQDSFRAISKTSQHVLSSLWKYLPLSSRTPSLLESQLLDFFSAIRDQRAPKTTVETAIRSMELGLAVHGILDYEANSLKSE